MDTTPLDVLEKSALHYLHRLTIKEKKALYLPLNRYYRFFFAGYLRESGIKACAMLLFPLCMTYHLGDIFIHLHGNCFP